MSELRAVLIAISSLIGVIATIPYLIDVAHGNLRPRIVSWFLWTLLAGIGAAASFAAGQVPAGVFVITVGLESAFVVMLGLNHGDRSLSKLDLICLAGGLVAVGTLVYLKSPTITLAVSMLVEIIATLPINRESWRHPFRPAWITYAMYLMSEAIILSLASPHVFASYAFPLLNLGEDALLLFAVLVSRNPPYQPLPQAVFAVAGAPSPRPVTPVLDQSAGPSTAEAPVKLSFSNPSVVAGAVGRSMVFTITAQGSPLPKAIGFSGTLPPGVAFINNADGTATLVGTPLMDAQGTFSVTVTAQSPAGQANQQLTITILPPVAADQS